MVIDIFWYIFVKTWAAWKNKKEAEGISQLKHNKKGKR